MAEVLIPRPDGDKKVLSKVPNKPGVYLFKDADGEVLYVGKARSLRKRVQSYFRSNLEPRIETMVEKMAGFVFYTTDNEVEAIFLECNLIKKYRPDFNVSYRDDKSYPFLAVTVDEDYPRFYVTRETRRKGPRYFGPYTKAWAVRETLDTLRRVFPVCTCSKSNFKRLKATGSACLDYHIKKCAGPCIDAISQTEYRKLVEEAMDFLAGRSSTVLRKLERDMNDTAAKLQYEKARVIRDRLAAARAVLEKQKIVSAAKVNEDIIGLATEGEDASAQVFQVRQGKLVGSQSFHLSVGAEAGSEDGVLSSFLKHYYSATTSTPPLILVPLPLAEVEALEGWLSKNRGKQVRLHRPERGRKRKLMEMAQKNAVHTLAVYKTRRPESERLASELGELQEKLGLTKAPKIVEAYDISTLRGLESVGSMVVFENGRPRKDRYRRFRVKDIDGQDDYAMMKQVLARRFQRARTPDKKFAAAPDLILVDGGKGQLTAALEALRESGLEDLNVVALAKEEEEVYLPGERLSRRWPQASGALSFLRRARDEAHRFAVSYHRGRRGRRMVESPLDEISGMGPKRKERLLKGLGGKRVSEASLEELRELLPKALAAKVFEATREPKKTGG